MELIKDIYFNTDKLVENTKVKVSYTGKLYQGNNDKVYLHYGYGQNWNNVNEVEMIKTDLGYQAELDLMGGDTLNFCFKNQSNEWDNNCGNNYIFNIEKKCNNVIGTTPSPVDTPVNVPGSPIGGFDGIKLGTPVDTPCEKNVYQVVTPTFENSYKTPVNNVNKTGFNEVVNTGFGVNDTNKFEKVVAPNVTPEAKIQKVDTTINAPKHLANPQPNNSIAIAPTGFDYWTKKIKETVMKLFSYVPKLISGNYKRFITKNNTNK